MSRHTFDLAADPRLHIPSYTKGVIVPQNFLDLLSGVVRAHHKEDDLTVVMSASLRLLSFTLHYQQIPNKANDKAGT